MEIGDQQKKFVFCGDLASGKTTAIRTLAEAELMTMDVPISDESEQQVKADTTVGFDFAILSIEGEPIYLYGTPGQDRFADTANFLFADALGIIVLIDASRRDSVKSLQRWLERAAEQSPDTPVVVALNRVHALGESLADLREQCRRSRAKVMSVAVADPRSKTEMVACIRQLLLAHMLP